VGGTGGEGEEVGGDAALLAVKQFYRVVGGTGGDEARAAEAVRILDSLTFHQAIVFCNHHTSAAGLASVLCAAGFPAAFVSGEHAQEERSAVVRRMHSFELRVLVCTDLLARGVDFGRVNLVLHLQPPRTLATYLHRVGRTGRFGSLGLSVALLRPREVAPLLAMLVRVRVAPKPLPSRLDEAQYLQHTTQPLQGRTPLKTRLPPAAAAARLEQLQQLRIEAGQRQEAGQVTATDAAATDADAATAAPPAVWPPTAARVNGGVEGVEAAERAEGGGRSMRLRDATATGATADEVTSFDEGGSTHGAAEEATAGERPPPLEAAAVVAAGFTAVARAAKAKEAHASAGLVSAEELAEARARGRRRALERARARANEHAE